MIDFLCLALIEIFIVDISGAIQNIVYPILEKVFRIKKEIPLIECSLCVVFHSGWIYLLCTGSFTLPLFLYTTLLAILSRNIAGLMRWLIDLLCKIESLLYKLIK